MQWRAVEAELEDLNTRSIVFLLQAALGKYLAVVDKLDILG